VRDTVGIDYLYDYAGNRVRQESGYVGQYVDHYDEPEEWPYQPIPVYGYFTGTKREDYAYDAVNRLTGLGASSTSWNAGTQSVNAAPTPTMSTTIGYDLMGRVTTKGAAPYSSGTVITYNAKGQLNTETTTSTVTSGGNTTVTTNVATYTYGTGSAYALGSALTIRTTSTSVLNGGSPTNNPTTLMTNTYVWWDGAVQDHQAYKPNESSGPTHDSQYTYAQVGGAAQLTTVTTDDGRPRTVTFRNDMNGQAIRRDEADNNASYGDPHEVWYRFAGKQIGFTGNNGAPDAEIANSSSGAFAGGSTSPTYYTDFDLSLTSYAFGSSRSIASTYAVEQGDTLESIAAMLWGDASLWYKIAEANGLQGGATLTAGQTLIIPAGIVRSSHNASTFAPYDPGEVINPITPTAPKPAKNKAACGGMGSIILMVVAIAVAAVVAPYATAWVGNMMAGASTLSVTGTLATGLAVTGGTVTATATVLGGAIAGAASSIASQGVGVATGIQDKFSWGAVALAAVGGGVGAGMNLDGVKAFTGGSGALGAGVRAALSSTITQGIGVATGLQDKFSWAGVAAAGVGGMVGKFVGDHPLPRTDAFGSLVASNAASGIAIAATRSLIEGTDFGDNLLAALPDIIGQTVGMAFTGAISGRRSSVGGSGSSSAEDEATLALENAGLPTDIRKNFDAAALRERGYQAGSYDVIIGKDGRAFRDTGRVGESGSDGVGTIFTDDDGASANMRRYTVDWVGWEGEEALSFISGGGGPRTLLSLGVYNETYGVTTSIGRFEMTSAQLAQAHAGRDALRAAERAGMYAAFQAESAYIRDYANRNISVPAVVAVGHIMPIAGTYFAGREFARDPTLLNGAALGLSLFGDGVLVVRGASLLRGAGGATSVADDAARTVGAADEMAEAGSIRGVNATRGNANCVNCVIATDATLAGRPASALGGGPFMPSVLEAHYGAKFGRPTTIDNIGALMADAGSGSRGIVYGARGPGEVAHTFNVVNQRGTVRFLDGQTGTAARVDGYEYFMLLRTN
jgi:uncharacterized RDD family membrane protein YckC